MQLHELPQKFSDIALTLGTSNCAGNLFLHQDATPRAEPTTTDAMASFPEHKLFRLFGLAYEAGVQVLGHAFELLRQFGDVLLAQCQANSVGLKTELHDPLDS